MLWSNSIHKLTKSCLLIQFLYYNDPKYLDRQVRINSLDQDQPGPEGAVWSVSTLFNIPSAWF